MPINVGKNAGIIYSDNDDVISFFNSEITTKDQDLYFFDAVSSTAIFQITPSAYRKYRCLHYNVYNTVQWVQHKNHIVLYRDVETNTVQPIFQATNVSANEIDGSYLVSFWSALKPGKTTKIKESQAQWDISVLGQYGQQNGQYYVYAYDPNKILRLRHDQLQDYQLQQQYKNIFCNIYVKFQTYFVATANDRESAQQQQVMIVDLPPKVLQQQDDMYPVFDFAGIGGGGSGGMKQHQHIPYVDGSGYAFAVFHPGTSMPQLSWKQI